MRILYILERFPELSQTFVAQELLGLTELGCEVRVAALQRGSGGLEPAEAVICSETRIARRGLSLCQQFAAAPESTSAQLHSDPNWPPPGGTKRLRGALRISPLFPEAQWSEHIHSHFATEAADIGRLLARAANRPFSFTAHGADSYAPPEQLAVNLASAEFARGASEHVANRLRDAAVSPADAQKVVEIPVAVDTHGFMRTTPYNAAGDIVSIGRLVEKKGFSTLISAFAAVQDSEPVRGRTLIIVGDGPLRGSLESQAAELDARVEFLGSQPPSAVAPRLCDASVFALSPHVAADGDRDGRPTVLVEAMAAGLPVLSTELPGITDLIDSSIGRLAEPESPASVAASLVDLLSMSDAARERMGTAGAAAAAPYGRLEVAQRLLGRFQSAAQTQPVS